MRIATPTRVVCANLFRTRLADIVSPCDECEDSLGDKVFPSLCCRMVLGRQYRHAARQYLWELVAGRMEPGENPKKGAQRELLEETGYRAKKFSIFLDLFPTPGFLEERMFLLLAEGLSAGEGKPEEDEKIIVASYTRTQLEEMMRTHKLRDAKSIAGLLFYFSLLGKGTSPGKK